MACAIMLQRGNTLPNMLSARFETAADAIIARIIPALPIFQPAIVLIAHEMTLARIS